jgi:hypothetical protein
LTRTILGWALVLFAVGSIVLFALTSLVSPSVVFAASPVVDASGWPDIRDAIIGFLLDVWSVPGVKFIVCHVIVNTVAAIAGSVYTGEFLLSRVAEFLHKKLLPYVAIYYVLILVEQGANLTGLSALAWAAIETSLLGDLLDTWERCGLPLPDAIRRYIRKGGGYGLLPAYTDGKTTLLPVPMGGTTDIDRRYLPGEGHG